jgi:hypothetical protein
VRASVLTAAIVLAAALSAPAAARADDPPFGNCAAPPKVVPTIPTSPGTGQANFNCYAWQEFIALNWLADATTCAADPDASASSFGEPGSGPVVWQTYKAPQDVFLADAEAPAAWCGSQDAARTRKPLELTALSKFDGNATPDLGDFHEASPGDSWLTAQSTLLTLYDIRMNQDEFDYILDNKLYDADVQQSFAADPGIDLPDELQGSTKTGSIELKAAWLELDDPADRQQYLTTEAIVTYPGQEPKQVTVGLVGLHIIHQTSGAPQFAWATFEHVGNAPSAADVANGRLQPSYTYFDPKCDAAKDVYGCKPNPDQDPKTDPYGAPVQVVRETSLGTGTQNDIVGLNTDVWQLIRSANPNSVFRNYQLVNVLWSNPGYRIAPGSRVPLGNGGQQPPPTFGAVANATMETYVQSRTCLDCHVNAPIAADDPRGSVAIARPRDPVKPVVSDDAPYAADYSFLLSRAQTAAAGGPGAGPIAGAAAGALLLAGAAAVVARRRRRR